IGAGVAAALTELILFRTARPPDEASALLGALWVAMPYLATAGLALLVRRHTPPLVVLLVAFRGASRPGPSLLGNPPPHQAAAGQQVKDAVLPGEDPSRGPAAMRKSGAEAGAAITWGLSILLLVAVPPVQLAAVVIPTGIAYAVSALGRRAGPEVGGEP